jgi:hypothetical protein
VESPSDQEPVNAIARAIVDIISKVPTTNEQLATDPSVRAKEIMRASALKAAAVSGAMTLTPGPLGMATVLPDLYSVWRIQAQMVADIAAAFGRSGELSQKQMLYCLFRHAAAQLFRDLVTRVGERVLFRKASLGVIQAIARGLGVRVTKKVIAQSVSRWLPAIGAVGMAGYAAWDTQSVGRTALELFSNPILDEVDEGSDA